MAVAAIRPAWWPCAVTLPADFLRYPAWLAAQKADFIIGPALTGLYWLRRRPQSPFGLMLIGWAFVGVLYILQSSSDSWLFTIGLFWEKVFGLATYVLILAFPTGRLDRPSKIVLTVGVVTVLVSSTAIQLLLPQLGAGGSISSCRSLCPRNELAITSDPALAPDLFKLFSCAVLALALAVAALVIHRFVTGTPPRGGRWPSARPSRCCSCCARSVSAARDRRRRGLGAVRHRHLGVRRRPRWRLVRLPVRADRRRAVRRARHAAAGRAVAAPSLQAGARADAARAARRSAAAAAVPGPRRSARRRAPAHRGGPRA